jgi:hypothetical protein
MQMRLGHCKLGDEMMVVSVLAPASALVTHLRPMCSSLQAPSPKAIAPSANSR